MKSPPLTWLEKTNFDACSMLSKLQDTYMMLNVGDFTNFSPFFHYHLVFLSTIFAQQDNHLSKCSITFLYLLYD